MARKSTLHPRSQHIDGYDFALLLGHVPELEAFTIRNPTGLATIDFQNPDAVRMLNRALLKSYYNVESWDIPANYLCPPIPGRADYIHHLADLLARDNGQKIPTGRKIKALDIGTGASLVYPLIGQSAYGWDFTGVDIDAGALASAQKINDLNDLGIDLRHQGASRNIFKGVITPDDMFHVTLCNPPFHASKEQAMKGTQRKWKNLGKGASDTLNFGGQHAELWCPGGEIKFIAQMIEESRAFADQCVWFTSLVSKKDSLAPIRRILDRAKVEYDVIDMAQGQKVSRFVAWSYVGEKQRAAVFKGVSN